MRIVYCHECGHVSTNVWTERDVCTHCGHAAERMDYRRPWQYYASSVVLLAAAAVFLWGPELDIAIRIVLFVAVVAVAFILSSWGMRATRAKILQEVRVRKLAEENA